MEDIKSTESPSLSGSTWSLYSRYGHLLLLLSRNSNSRLSDLAVQIGVTDRQIRSLLKPLHDAGAVKIERVGRNNRYMVNTTYSFSHPLENMIQVQQWLEWHDTIH